MTVRGHLHAVPEQGLPAQREALLDESRRLWAGLGAVLLEVEVAQPSELYELHRKGERVATALSIVHDELAKLSELEEPCTD